MPDEEIQSKLGDLAASMRALEIARAVACPTIVIRDGWDDGAQADYETWADFDHVVGCPSAAPCHQAFLLLQAKDEAGFKAFIDRYLPEPQW